MERFYIVRLDATAQHERQFDRQDQVLARELHLQFGKDAQVWKASEDMAGGWYPDTKDPVAYEEGLGVEVLDELHRIDLGG